jgi:hypothetical protein
VALEANRAARLARALRDLRESHWPDVELTQAQLAAALSAESRVAPATISSWESTTNPKTPTATRLSAYARFFATRRSLEDGPHLVAEARLTAEERSEFHRIEEELLGLLHGQDDERRRTFTFDDGPVTVICPEAPRGAQGPLAREKDPNFAKLQQYADLDALIEIYGHVRASNPTLDVFHRLTTEVVADDLSTHVIVLGGIAWNQVTKRIQDAISQVLPIKQVEDPSLKTGELFVVAGQSEPFRPKWDDPDSEERELVEDVAYLARLPNPFKISRTLTICNGVHSRGVLGAVRCLTDARVRDANEKYLAERFPDGRFALLLRVPVVANETLSPDLQNPDARLYEWPPQEGGRR